jgi:hypothetical protein
MNVCERERQREGERDREIERGESNRTYGTV